MRGQFSWTVGPDLRGWRGGLLRVQPSRRSGPAIWQAHVTDDGQRRVIIHGDRPSWNWFGGDVVPGCRIWAAICAAAARESFTGIGWSHGTGDRCQAARARYFPVESGRHAEAEPYLLDWAAGEIRSPLRPPLRISQKQADIFYLLDKHLGRFVSTERLISRIWSRGDEPGHPEVTLRTHIAALRIRVQPLGLVIESRRDYGYRLTFRMAHWPPMTGAASPMPAVEELP